jgi:hypothetical protein
MVSKEKRLIKSLTPKALKTQPIATDMHLPNHSGDHSAGNTGTPTDDNHLVNKKYVDDVVAGDIDINFLTGATYTTIQDFINTNASTGTITGGVVTDGGSGTVDISSGSFMVRLTDDPVGDLYSANFSAVTGQALTDNSANFVYVSYNGGTPTITVSTTPLSDVHTNVVLGIVYRIGSELHITNVGIPTSQFNQKMARRLAFVEGLTRQSGSLTSEVGTRNIAITSGVWWLALDEYTISAVDTSASDTFSYFYSDGAGGFTEVTGQTQVDNTQYDDGSGTLATLGNAKYGTHWVYRGVDGDTYIIYGLGSYNLTEAEEALPPTSLPPQITGFHAALVAKIVIQKSASTFTSLQNPFDTVFGIGTALDHNDLTSIGTNTHAQIDTHIADTTDAHTVSSDTLTFTNKTFDANATGNSLSNVDVADLANGTDGELITWDASGNPATVATGTATHVLTSNGAGAAPTFQAAAGGGSPGGADTHVQFNDGGAFGGDTGFTFNETSNVVTVSGSYSVDPGGDVDTDVISVNVTGTPKISWDESESEFDINTSVNITGNLDVSTVATVGTLDVTATSTFQNDVTMSGNLTIANAIIHDGDTDTKIEFTTNQMEFTCGNVEFMNFETTGQDTIVFNEGSADIDFRVESNGNANMLMINGGGNTVGIGTAGGTATLENSGGFIGGSVSNITAAGTTMNPKTAIFYNCNATAAAFTITLPPANTMAGAIFHIMKVDASAFAVTVGITAMSGDNIGLSGAAHVLGTQYHAVTVISNGANTWSIMGQEP